MSITFYPTFGQDDIRQNTPAISRMLLPVSSWAGYKLRLQKKRGLTQERVLGSIPVPRIPAGTAIAADCGGFVATRIWGDYRYTPEQYVQWLRGIHPDWAATMDYCCEDEITNGKPGIVRERQDRTTAMAHFFWQTYRPVPWVWVPTIQGWTVEDYQRHAAELKPLIDEMQAVYANNPNWRVGVGTLCNRADTQMIHDVAAAISAILPGVPLHLWGIKLSALLSPVALPQQVVSVDSAAWDSMFFGENEEWKNSGVTRHEWSIKNALPRYEAKIAAALSQPKQLSLLDCEVGA